MGWWFGRILTFEVVANPQAERSRAGGQSGTD
jgi:hypothetical protein